MRAELIGAICRAAQLILPLLTPQHCPRLDPEPLRATAIRAKLPEQLQDCRDGAGARPSPRLKLLPITIQIKHFHNHNQQLPAVCEVTKKGFLK